MMTETDTTTPTALPASDDFAAAQQKRVYLFTLLGLGLAAAAAVSFLFLGTGSLILPMLLLVTLMTLLSIWHHPIVTFYILFTATVLFETNISLSPDAIIERVPFFWNFNTIMEFYANSNFKILPINLVEILLFIYVVCAGIRAAYNHHGKILLGPLFLPIIAYICFVIFGWINGIATGGDVNISLQEVRPQLYFLIAYLMAVNIITTPRRLQQIYWIWCSVSVSKGLSTQLDVIRSLQACLCPIRV